VPIPALRLGLCLLSLAPLASSAQSKLEYPLLLQHPTANQREIVFSFAGDLWSVPLSGGRATILTKGLGTASLPMFSPDGTKLAFTWGVRGNQDVYIMDPPGSTPRRLTFHPGRRISQPAESTLRRQAKCVRMPDSVAAIFVRIGPVFGG